MRICSLLPAAAEIAIAISGNAYFSRRTLRLANGLGTLARIVYLDDSSQGLPPDFVMRLTGTI
jgi:hypothetical protein